MSRNCFYFQGCQIFNYLSVHQNISCLITDSDTKTKRLITSSEIKASSSKAFAMNLFQVTLVASMFLYFFWFSDCCIEQVQKAYIKSVRCNVSDKFVYPNVTCYAKSFNRSCSTATVIGTSKMPLNRIYVRFMPD